MKRSILSILLLLMFYPDSYSQKQHVRDSLMRLINATAYEDTSRVLLLFEYSGTFYPSNPDSLEAINKQVVALSEKLNFPYGIIRGMNGMAMAHWIRNDLSSARDIFIKALQVADANEMIALQVMVGDNLGLLYHNQGALDSAEYYYLRAIEAGKGKGIIKHYAKSFTDLAMNYHSKDNYIEAIHYQMEAIKYNAVAGDKKNEVANCIGLGNIYMGIRDFDQAIAAYREAERLNDSLKDINFKLSVLQNIGLLYVEINSNADSARYYLEKAAKMALANNKMEVYLTSLINLGNVEKKEKNYKLALKYYLEAYESQVFQRRNYERAAILVNLGAVLMELGDLSRAEKHAREGVDLAHAGGYLDFERVGLFVLAQIAAEKKDFKTAYNYQMRADTIKDSIWSIEVKSRISEATYNFALKQAETENTLLLKDNEINRQTIYVQWFVVGGIFVILMLITILMVVLIRTNRRQNSMNKILDQKNVQLQELNLTKDKFISIIAHDLKSPFNALLGLLTELDENYEHYDEETRHTIIHNLKKSSFNTFNLLVNLLEWSQSQQGKLKSDPEDFLLKNVMDEVFTLLSTRAAMKKQILSKDFSDDLVLHTDPKIIKSILINLVNNAIKFTQHEGRIIVSAKIVDNAVHIIVEDSGIGIPEDQIDALFRLDSGFQRKGTEQEPGTGLGLVMCHEYVALIGGEIRVSSEPGKGSKFLVAVPLEIGTNVTFDQR